MPYDDRPDSIDHLIILDHPKVRLFMTHGGCLGIIEAVHSGIPVIGIPFFFDQSRNILKMVEHGSGILLDYHSLTSDIIYDAIMTIISNNR